MIRYLAIIVDFSQASHKQDIRPTRGVIVKAFVQDFIREFAEQNPLSKMCVVATYKEGARLLSDFVHSPEDHCSRIVEFKDFEGNPSLQNSLELAADNFKAVPQYASKEVLCVFSSLTNSDPGDIFTTIGRLKNEQVCCNVISLSAAIYVLQHLAKTTFGQFRLAKDKDHLKELLRIFLVPSLPFDQKEKAKAESVHKI